MEAGRKKSLMPILSFAIAVITISAIMAVVAPGILKTASLILLIFGGVGLFESLLLLPGLVNIVETFNKGNDKIYHFKREEV